MRRALGIPTRCSSLPRAHVRIESRRAFASRGAKGEAGDEPNTVHVRLTDAMVEEETHTRRKLLRCTKASLGAFCEAEGVQTRSGMTKASLVQVLMNHWRERFERAASRHVLDARPARLTAAMLNVGGMDEVVAELDARVWLPHVAPAALRSRLDITPPIGVLLYGPPGCGKSHVAVALANALSPRRPRIVRGPELKKALWGADEDAVRSLFDDHDERDGIDEGEDDDDDSDDDDAFLNLLRGRAKRSIAAASASTAAGDIDLDAPRVVILDEAEALLSARSDSTSHANDKHYNSVVQQFLACMDGAAERLAERAGDERAGDGHGPEARPPRLLLALTNRRDLLDPALLRPGRFEVQIALPPPCEAGRVQILTLLMAPLRANGALDPAADDDLSLLARASLGFSGADLTGVLRAAKAEALRRAMHEARQSPIQDAEAAALGGAHGAGEASEGCAPKAAVLREDLRMAMRAELERREQRGEPSTSVALFDSYTSLSGEVARPP